MTKHEDFRLCRDFLPRSGYCLLEKGHELQHQDSGGYCWPQGLPACSGCIGGDPTDCGRTHQFNSLQHWRETQRAAEGV